MPCTFADYPISMLTPEYAGFIDHFHSWEDFEYADVWCYDNTGLLHLPLPSLPAPPPPEVGKMVWPTGMSRCSVFPCLIHSDQLDDIHTALGSGVCGPADLVMDDGTNTVTFSDLYLVAERPLSQIDGEGQVYLCLLVDKRWFLRKKTGSVASTPASWSSLLTTLASQLGIALTVDTIDADYGAPTDRWVLSEKPLSVLIDAVCNVISHRIVANLDGTYETQNYTTAAAASDAQTAALVWMAGGLLVDADTLRSAPASVKVVFRTAGSENLYTVVKTLSSLSVTGYGSATGVSNQQKTIYAELVYTGSNATACSNYAAQAATDYYLWRTVDADVTYPAATEWSPTGAEDRVEWKYQIDRILTRVVRPPFQRLVRGDVEAPAPFDQIGGGFVAGVTTTSCLLLEVVRSYGSCSPVPETQAIVLTWDAVDSRYESTSNFVYNGGNGAVNYTPTAPVGTLTIGGVSGYFLGSDLRGLLYSFGGSTLCSGTGCGSYFVVRISCYPCPTTDQSYTAPNQYVVPPDYSLGITQYVLGVTNTDPLNFVQFTVDAPETGGISQLTVDLTAPDGTVYQLVAEPASLTATTGQFILDPSASTTLASLTIAPPDAAYGIYQAVDDFSAYTGPKNGLWTLTVTNASGQQMTISSFVLTFGSPTTSLTITGSADPDTGSAPLSTDLSWTIGGTGSAQFVYVDWGDGSNVEFFATDDYPQSHTYAADGSYEIIVRVYDVNGAYAEDSVPVTVVTTVTIGCGTFAETLTATVAAGGGLCTLFDGQVATLTYNSGTGKWAGSIVSSGETLNFLLYCNGGGSGPSDMRLDVSCNSGISDTNNSPDGGATVHLMTFSGITQAGPCCSFGATLNVTVSD